VRLPTSSTAQTDEQIGKEFDRYSGSRTERLLFNHRGMVLIFCLLTTLFLGYQLTHLRLNADFESTIPTGHPYIRNYLDNRASLSEAGNVIRIAVVNTAGSSIYDPKYLATLQKISDEVFLLPGVYRQYMKSLWTPTTVWTAVTEQGLDSGPVIPSNFDYSPTAIQQLRFNVGRSGEIGKLVSLDQRSSIIQVPMLDHDPTTGAPLDYAKFAEHLESLRIKYEDQGIHIHITGYAQIVGDIIHALHQILLFFLLAVAITVAVLYTYTQCVRSTFLVIGCSLLAVGWELGALPLFGMDLETYSILVPFLIFAIGISHGAQKMNDITQDIGRGVDRLIAARLTFRRLFIAGFTALLCDAVGFAVLLLIDIQVIRNLAIIASLGVAILIFTNLMLLPILLSYVGVSIPTARRGTETKESTSSTPLLWKLLACFTQRSWAIMAVLGALIVGFGAFELRSKLKIGDLDPGAPELRVDSRYNLDNAFMTTHYGSSSDVFAIMVKTPDGTCASYNTLSRMDALEWQLAQLPCVQFTRSAALFDRYLLTAFNEGNPKWYGLTPNSSLLNNLTTRVPSDLVNASCSLLTLYAHLADHKADTLSAIVSTVEQFKQNNDSPQAQFLLAAGNAGIEAATNEVIKHASQQIMLWVYGAVILLCLATFRSWRAVVCVIIPLVLTSLLCEALMVVLGIGVKVTTLPVVALGVGIGVDYALYVMSITLVHLRKGESLSQAYLQALAFTGKVVMLTGITLGVSVSTWAFRTIKFQADMGVLLAFMFIWNMLGALVLVPSLSCFLLLSKGSDTTTIKIPQKATEDSGLF
jgi:predicted RND superfamily exporter protein